MPPFHKDFAMQPQDIICKKREGQKLTPAEINAFVQGINDWSIADGQIAAMLMATLINGTDTDEIVELVKAVVDTGMVLNWDAVDLNGPVASVYAMPGVGDKVEIIAGAVLAACGLYVPMICDRMQYHTGGTMDKLDSILGYDSHPTYSRFKKALRDSGCAFMTSTEQFAPADMRIQAIRDITATVESLPLLISSMLTKKVTSGIRKLTVDVKAGSGAFTKTQAEAEHCIDLIKQCLPAFGIDANFTISDMNQVTGQNIGNSLEIYEIWDYLTGASGTRDADIHALVKRVSSAALLLNGICATQGEADAKVDSVVASGAAAEQFGRILTAMGVSPAFMNNPAPFLQTASVIRPIYPDKAGTVKGMNLRWIGLSVLEMGAGRLFQEQKIDYSAGYTNMCKVGMYVSPQVPLAFVHAHDEATADAAETHLRGAVQIES